MPLHRLLLLAIAGNFVITGSRLALTLYTLKLGGTPFLVGVLQAGYSVLPLVLAVAVGRWVDRVGTRLPMLIATPLFLFAPLAPAFFATIPALFVAGTLFGAGFLLYSAAMQNLVGGLGTAETRTRRFSWFMIGTATGNTLGPVTIGIAIDHLGFVPAFLILAVPLAVVFLWKLRDRETDLAGTPSTGAGRHASLMSLLTEPVLLGTVVASTILSVAWDSFSLMTPIHGTAIGLTASAIGIVMGCFPGSMITIRLFLPRMLRRFTEWNILAVGFVCCALGYAYFPFTTSGLTLAVAAIVIGFGVGVGFPLVLSLSFTASPSGRQGEVQGVRSAAGNACHVVIPAAVGGASSALGLTAVFWALAALLAATGVAAHRWDRMSARRKAEPR